MDHLDQLRRLGHPRLVDPLGLGRRYCRPILVDLVRLAHLQDLLDLVGQPYPAYRSCRNRLGSLAYRLDQLDLVDPLDLAYLEGRCRPLDLVDQLDRLDLVDQLDLAVFRTYRLGLGYLENLVHLGFHVGLEDLVVHNGR